MSARHVNKRPRKEKVTEIKYASGLCESGGGVVNRGGGRSKNPPGGRYLHCWSRQNPQIIGRATASRGGMNGAGLRNSKGIRRGGECTEKIFHATQGKRSSGGAQQRGMVQCDMTLTLAWDKWEVGGIWLGSRSCLWVLRLFTCFPVQKN